MGGSERKRSSERGKTVRQPAREPSSDSLFTLTRLLLDLINNSWRTQKKKQESAKEERTNVFVLKREINYGDSHWRGGHDSVCVAYSIILALYCGCRLSVDTVSDKRDYERIRY